MIHINDFQPLELRRLGEVVVMTPTWFMKEKCESYGAASPWTQAYVTATHTDWSSPCAGTAFANEELARRIRAFESCTETCEKCKARRLRNANQDV
mgnify:CR=1 FL=1